MDTRHLAGLRVLAVDDNAPSRQLLSLLFDSAGAHVDEAEDGGEAVRMCALEAFDAVLMDLQMPVMDGIEATRLIRAHEAQSPSLSRALIVGVTAHALAEYRDLCLAAGMDLVITKPIDPETILLRIGALLQDRPRSEAAN